VSRNLSIRMRIEGFVYLFGFIASIPTANWMIGNVGTCIPNGPCVIPVGFGWEAPSGVLVIGAAFVLRDAIQRLLGFWWAVGAIVAGVGLSAIFAEPSLVIASATAFALAEFADLAVYTPLQKRRLIWAVGLSGLTGAIVDSAVFLWIAFGSLQFIEGQVWGKLLMTLLAIPAILVWRKGFDRAALKGSSQ